MRKFHPRESEPEHHSIGIVYPDFVLTEEGMRTHEHALLSGLKLYAPTYRAIFRAFRARDKMIRVHRLRARITSLDIETRFGMLEGIVVLPPWAKRFAPDELIAGLAGWRDFLLEHDATIGTLAGASMSLLAGNVTKSFTLGHREPRCLDALYLGGRQDMIEGGIFDVPVEFWDISSAFPWAMKGAPIARGYQHYNGDVPIDEIGFVRATVLLPDGARYGPLPLPNRSGPFETHIYPRRGRHLDGWWAIPEVRAAQDEGALVVIHEGYVAFGVDSGFFDEWFAVIVAGREHPDRVTRSMMKATANALWGFLGVHGFDQIAEHRGTAVAHSAGVEHVPICKSYAAHISATVRARLYAEALAPLGDRAFFCHTDMVCVLANESPRGEKENGFGSWKRKACAEKLYLSSPQFYKYIDGEGAHYVTAGVEDARSADRFERAVSRSGFDQPIAPFIAREHAFRP